VFCVCVSNIVLWYVCVWCVSLPVCFEGMYDCMRVWCVRGVECTRECLCEYVFCVVCVKYTFLVIMWVFFECVLCLCCV